MNIVLFTHPAFLDSQSMPRYANLLKLGLIKRGHSVDIWKPISIFYKVPCNKKYKKWLGYIDQYLVFPILVRLKLLTVPENTLFVFSDQALGPWVPLVKHRPHVIHCHDFLALKSALGKVPENPVSRTGKIYQSYIQKGFSHGLNFISISLKTQADLRLYHLSVIKSSGLCYNWLNGHYEILDPEFSRNIIGNRINLPVNTGYILHIGGNQYYKNRIGIIEIYNAWRLDPRNVLPLILVGSAPSAELETVAGYSSFKQDIHFITDLEDEYINEAYSGASCLIFPSLDEGFGWPIVEAMASGCPVLTTNVAPMSEVAGLAGLFIEKRPVDKTLAHVWATESAIKLSNICNATEDERMRQIRAGIENIKRFDENMALDHLQFMYSQVLSGLNS